MRKGLQGSMRKKVLVASSTGFQAKLKQKKRKPVKTKPGRENMMEGVRRRKTVRGNTISPEIIQINMKITSHGPKNIEEVLKVKDDKEKK
jgi:small subunit ribosomal protein S6e